MKQVQAFLAEADSDDLLGAPLRLMLDMGCRRSELLGLRWSDVDLDAGTVTVRRVVVLDATTGRAAVVDGTKSAGSQRVLPVWASSVRALRAHRRRQQELALALGVPWAADLPVAANEHLGVFRPQRFGRVLKATCGRGCRIWGRISCAGRR